jgi:hypothetical protein
MDRVCWPFSEFDRHFGPGLPTYGAGNPAFIHGIVPFLDCQNAFFAFSGYGLPFLLEGTCFHM